MSLFFCVQVTWDASGICRKPLARRAGHRGSGDRVLARAACSAAAGEEGERQTLISCRRFPDETTQFPAAPMESPGQPKPPCCRRCSSIEPNPDIRFSPSERPIVCQTREIVGLLGPRSGKNYQIPVRYVQKAPGTDSARIRKVSRSNDRPENSPRGSQSSSDSRESCLQNRDRVRALEDLARGSGPPLTTTELARMIGMSPTFIRLEIGSGYLRAVRLGRGRRPVFRIPVREACRYVKKLGLL
jgi:hypothetical protein